MKLSSVFKHLGKIIGFAILIAIFSLVVSIYWDLSRGDSSDYVELKKAILQYGDDLNDMREYLYLPRNNYDFFSAEDLEIDTSAEPEEREEPYITGISTFAEELAAGKNLAKKQAETQQKLSELISKEDFSAEIANLGLSIDQNLLTNDQHVSAKVLNGSDALAQIVFDLNDNKVAVLSILGRDDILVNEGETLSQKITTYLQENKDRIGEMKNTLESRQNEMRGLLTEVEINSILQENNLTVNIDPVETESGFETYVTDTDGSPLLTVLLDRKTGNFMIEQTSLQNIDELRESFGEKLKTLNGQSEYIRNIEQKKANLEAYLKGDEIKQTFGGSQIETKEGRLEEGRIYYDLVFKEGNSEELLGTIIFDEATGDVSFLKVGETEEIDLEEVLGSKKKS